MANGFDIGSLIQAAQLGRSLNPAVMQQQALGNQLALQLQQLQAQKIQQDLADPQRAIREAAILEDIRRGGTLGLSVLGEGEQALGPVLQPTGINRLAFSQASADAANKRLLDQMFAKERGLQEVRSEFDKPLTMMMDGREVYARRGPGDTMVPLERVIPEVRTVEQMGALNIPQAPSQPRIDESSLQSLIEGQMGGLGVDQGLAGMAIPEGSRETVVPERRELVEASPRFGSFRTFSPNARVALAKSLGKTETPLDQIDPSVLSTPEAEAAYKAGLKERELGLDLKPGVEESRSFRMNVSVGRTIDSALDKIAEFQTTGSFPGISQTAVNQFLSSRPDTISGLSIIPGGQAVYSAFQRAVRNSQTPESRALEMRRAVITATILRAQAGLAQTGIELTNIVPYTPQINDSEESLIDKLNFLKEINNQDLEIFEGLYPSLRGKSSGQRAPTQRSNQTVEMTAPNGQKVPVHISKVEEAKKRGLK